MTGLPERLTAVLEAGHFAEKFPGRFRIFGYSGFAMILFALAAVGTAWFAVQIVRHDRTVRRR